MKISGVKFNVNVDVGEFDLDLGDVVDVMRLEHEQRKELRHECYAISEHDRHINEVKKAGPSSETKNFIEAVVNKAIASIKEQVIDAIKHGGSRKQPVDPDERIED